MRLNLLPYCAPLLLLQVAHSGWVLDTSMICFSVQPIDLASCLPTICPTCRYRGFLIVPCPRGLGILYGPA